MAPEQLQPGTVNRRAVHWCWSVQGSSRLMHPKLAVGDATLLPPATQHLIIRPRTWTPQQPPPARWLCAPPPPAPAWLPQCTRPGWWTRPAGRQSRRQVAEAIQSLLGNWLSPSDGLAHPIQVPAAHAQADPHSSLLRMHRPTHTTAACCSCTHDAKTPTALACWSRRSSFWRARARCLRNCRLGTTICSGRDRVSEDDGHG